MSSTSRTTRSLTDRAGDGHLEWTEDRGHVGPSVVVVDPDEDSAETAFSGVTEEPTLDTPKPRPAIERRRSTSQLRLDTVCAVDDLCAVERLTQLIDDLRHVMHPVVVVPTALVPGPDGGWAVASPRVEGVEMRRLLRSGPMEVPAALAAVAELAEGLEFAWWALDDRGRPLHLTHGALSIESLMVDLTGQVRVLLPGIVRAARGTVEPDAAACDDVYALGTLVYQLTTGDAFGVCLPEASSHARRVAAAVDRLTLAGVPEQASTIVARALAFEPAFRPSRVEMISALRASVLPIPEVEEHPEEPHPEEPVLPLVWKPGWAVVLGLLFGLVVLGASESLPGWAAVLH